MHISYCNFIFYDIKFDKIFVIIILEKQ